MRPAFRSSRRSSLVALVAFAFGAALGGRFISVHSHHRGRLLGVAGAVQLVLLGVGVALAVMERSNLHAGYRDLLITALAGAMGLQNATARKLAVPDLTTTVLTLTITGIVADSALLGGAGAKSGRRLISVIAMLVGALAGAMLVIHAGSYAPLIVAVAIVALVAGVALSLGRSTEAWTSG
ncbi:MAG TPA: DUF1275 family protein [Acidimicrobiales bacterium]|nr:DUF1275 family protein [Acidimicrobiales bacterium]